MEIPAKAAPYLLERIAFDLFGTLTFAGSLPSLRHMWSSAWEHMRQASVIAGIAYSRELIAIRFECGEIGGRPHFHYLLGGLGLTNVTTAIYRLRRHWRLYGAGFAVIRPFDRARSGVAYLSKCLDISQGDSYELRKFASSDMVVISEGLVRLLASQCRHKALATLSGVDRKQGVAETHLLSRDRNDLSGWADPQTTQQPCAGKPAFKKGSDGLISINWLDESRVITQAN